MFNPCSLCTNNTHRVSSRFDKNEDLAQGNMFTHNELAILQSRSHYSQERSKLEEARRELYCPDFDAKDIDEIFDRIADEEARKIHGDQIDHETKTKFLRDLQRHPEHCPTYHLFHQNALKYESLGFELERVLYMQDIIHQLEEFGTQFTQREVQPAENALVGLLRDVLEPEEKTERKPLNDPEPPKQP